MRPPSSRPSWVWRSGGALKPVSRGTAAPNKEVNMEFMGEYISDLPAPQGYVFLGMLEPDEKKEDPSDENDDE